MQQGFEETLGAMCIYPFNLHNLAEGHFKTAYLVYCY